MMLKIISLAAYLFLNCAALASGVAADSASLSSDSIKVKNGSMTKEEAMNAAKDAASSVSVKDILANSSSTETVPNFGSDVSELKNLFNKVPFSSSLQ